MHFVDLLLLLLLLLWCYMVQNAVAGLHLLYLLDLLLQRQWCAAWCSTLLLA
jgi:hypothetical protein